MRGQEGMVIPVDGVHHVHQSSPGKGISVIGVVCRLGIHVSLLYLSRRGRDSGKKFRKVLRER